MIVLVSVLVLGATLGLELHLVRVLEQRASKGGSADLRERANALIEEEEQANRARAVEEGERDKELAAFARVVRRLRLEVEDAKAVAAHAQERVERLESAREPSSPHIFSRVDRTPPVAFGEPLQYENGFERASVDSGVASPVDSVAQHTTYAARALSIDGSDDSDLENG